MTRGPIITAWVLSLTGAVASDTWRPPTPVGTQRDHGSNGLVALYSDRAGLARSAA